MSQPQYPEGKGDPPAMSHLTSLMKDEIKLEDIQKLVGGSTPLYLRKFTYDGDVSGLRKGTNYGHVVVTVHATSKKDPLLTGIVVHFHTKEGTRCTSNFIDSSSVDTLTDWRDPFVFVECKTCNAMYGQPIHQSEDTGQFLEWLVNAGDTPDTFTGTALMCVSCMKEGRDHTVTMSVEDGTEDDEIE